MKCFYIKLKYNLIAINKYNQDKALNSFNNSILSSKFYDIFPLNVLFNLAQVKSKST